MRDVTAESKLWSIQCMGGTLSREKPKVLTMIHLPISERDLENEATIMGS